MKKLVLIMVFFLLILAVTQNSYGEDIDWDRLVSAVIQVESGGNPTAVSKAGAIGLMGITPVVLFEFFENTLPWQRFCGQREEVDGSVSNLYFENNIQDLFYPEVNIIVGTWYLHRLHDHYGCKTIEQICAAYNGGPTRLKKCGYDINKMPRESRAYVKKVVSIYNKGE